MTVPGNASTPQSWSFLIDDTPPVGYFDTADSLHPTEVKAVLSDSWLGVGWGVYRDRR